MVSERNRIIRLKEYIESFGIEVNIGKNKARGNKGFFRGTKSGLYRIDVAKKLDDNEIISVLLHEFAHFVHFIYDKTLSSLDFAFENFNEEIQEELVNITVRKIPKSEAKALFDKKDELVLDVKNMANIIKKNYPDFRLSAPFKKFENKFNLTLKYLLKYDRVNFNNTIYSVENIDKDFYELSNEECLYIKIRAKQRMIRKINNRISRLNRYYNSPTELFARFIELFYTNKEETCKLAPLSIKAFKNIKEFNNMHC